MTGDRGDADLLGGEQTDVDAALVVAVHDHDVAVTAVEHLVVESNQGGAILGLDERERHDCNTWPAFGDGLALRIAW